MASRFPRAIVIAASLIACDDLSHPLAPAARTVSASAAHDAEYRIVDLGTLGGTWSYGNAINDHGVVVGESETATGTTHAFAWFPNGEHGSSGTMQDLGVAPGWDCSGALGINNRGDIAGYVCKGNLARPVVWRKTGPSSYVIEMLEHLGGNKGSARAITSGGDIVVGNSCIPGSIPHAMQWSLKGGTLNIGTAGGIRAAAWAVNEKGQVVVVRDQFINAFVRSYVWTEGRGLRDIGNLGGTGPTHGTAATAINDRGEVVGASFTSDGENHAFLWDETSGIRDLGTLGGPFATGMGINNSGMVVGYSATAEGGLNAFVWTADGGMRNLGSAVEGGYSDGWDINERGDIAGSADMPGGQLHAILWKRIATGKI